MVEHLRLINRLLVYKYKTIHTWVTQDSPDEAIRDLTDEALSPNVAKTTRPQPERLRTGVAQTLMQRD